MSFTITGNVFTYTVHPTLQSQIGTYVIVAQVCDG